MNDFIARQEAEANKGKPQRSLRHEAVKQQIEADLHVKHKAIPYMAGAFGPDHEGADAYVEEYITPEEGGSLVKLYGCNYLLKYPPRAHNQGIAPGRTEGLELAKALFSEIPRDIIAQGYVYLLALGFRFLFQRKKFYHDLNKFMWAIEWRVVRHYDPQPNEWNKYSLELNRAVNIAIFSEFKINITKSLDPESSIVLDSPWEARGEIKWGKNELGHLLLKVKRFVMLVLESDPCYRFPLQDAFGEKPKDVFQLLDILMSRYTTDGGKVMPAKWQFIKKGLKLGFWLEPRLKRVIQVFFQEANPDKLSMDEADFYFASRYKSYNFRGMSFEQRDKIRQEMDLKGETVYLI